MSILVLGTVALDTVKTPSGRRQDILGGSAVHFAMSGRLFTKVNIVANVGSDFPNRHLAFLREKGVVLTSLIRECGKSFKWEGEYQGNLNTALTINTELGVLATFRPKVSEEQRRIRHIFLANVDPDLQMHLLTKMHSLQIAGLDTMNFWIQHKPKALLRVLKKVNIFVVNDQEARDLSDEFNLIKAARYLRSQGPQMVLIKKGEHGVLFYSDKFVVSLPAYAVDKVVDPTGAGDTFAGGFMGYLTQAKKINAATIKKALAYGTVAASFNVEAFGTEKTSSLTLRQLNQRLTQFRKSILF